MSYDATLSDFKPGTRVRYIPGVARGNINHEACENGIVTSTNEKYVFVRFKGETSQACNISDLAIMG